MFRHPFARVTFWLLVVLPGIPFVLGSVAYGIYVFWPRDYSAVTDVALAPATEHLLLAAHGVRDRPASWSDGLAVLAGKRQPGLQAISLDWRPFSDNPFLCSVMARRIGRALGEKFAAQKHLKTVHAVGHSCGAFVVLGLCEGLKSRAEAPRIHTTYLDPVSVYAGFFWQYGRNHFGSCADFSDNYFDHRDGVPGSDEALPLTYNVDVTELGVQLADREPPHNWPTRYYLQAYGSGVVPLQASFDDFPRGTETNALPSAAHTKP